MCPGVWVLVACASSWSKTATPATPSAEIGGRAESPKHQEACAVANAEKLLGPQVRGEQLPTPYLRHGTILRGRLETPSGVESSYRGCAETGLNIPLGYNNGASFNRFILTAGADLATTEKRKSLVVDYLEIVLHAELLSSFDTLVKEFNLPMGKRARNTPGVKRQVRQVRDLRRKYGAAIKVADLEGQSPWRVAAYALQGNRLLRVELTLDAEGTVQVETTVLEKDLPVPMHL
ncbi:hypothetical protein ACFL6C_08410 [Myxococcota bacterium]